MYPPLSRLLENVDVWGNLAWEGIHVLESLLGKLGKVIQRLIHHASVDEVEFSFACLVVVGVANLKLAI